MMQVRRFRVVFVDDEVRLLDGLRRVMHAHRHPWDLEFVSSATEALNVLAAAPADAIVSDMRMPCIDGATLLRRVAVAHPHTIRIVLSGQADPVLVRRAAPVVHQFLSKPLDPASLLATIASLEHASGLLGGVDARLHAVAGDHLRVDAAAYARLTATCDREGASVSDAAAVIETDPALTARALQLAGSEFVNGTRYVPDIAEAVTALGIELLRSLLVDGALGTPSPPSTAAADGALRRRARAVARIARDMAPAHLARCCHLAGLLHEIAALCVDDVARAGADQAELGAYLLAIWGFPAEIARSVELQRDPDRIAPADTAAACLRAAIVLAAADSRS